MNSSQTPQAGNGPLKPRTHMIVLEDLEIMADIGFHDFEVGVRQALLVTVKVWLDLAFWPQEDTREAAWDYDFIRTEIRQMLETKRYNLQECLAGEIFELIAARPGVIGLSIETRKPDVYPDARSVGVVVSSF